MVVDEKNVGHICILVVIVFSNQNWCRIHVVTDHNVKKLVVVVNY